MKCPICENEMSHGTASIRSSLAVLMGGMPISALYFYEDPAGNDRTIKILDIAPILKPFRRRQHSPVAFYCDSCSAVLIAPNETSHTKSQ